MADALLIVLTSPVDGKEDAYNDWYTSKHVPEIVQNCDGFVAGRRYRLSDIQQNVNPNGPRYAAIYEVAGDVAAAARSLGAFLQSGKATATDAMDREKTMVLWAQPVTERITG